MTITHGYWLGHVQFARWHVQESCRLEIMITSNLSQQLFFWVKPVDMLNLIILSGYKLKSYMDIRGGVMPNKPLA